MFLLKQTLETEEEEENTLRLVTMAKSDSREAFLRALFQKVL